MAKANTKSVKKAKTVKKAKKASAKKKTTKKASKSKNIDYPRHSIEKSLRWPKAILDQNAGKACSNEMAAKFLGLKYNGPVQVEISSAIKYGFLERPTSGKIAVTDRAKKAIKPQKTEDVLASYRDAVISTPLISDVYRHYRGENLPEKDEFFVNTLTDKFKIPKDKVDDFKKIFVENLTLAKLIYEQDGSQRVLDITAGNVENPENAKQIAKLSESADIKEGDRCFVMMPFADPIGKYFSEIYEPAIEKTGLTPVRADDDIFTTGKIIDQIWDGINNAKVLVAELTDRNPNVFYELGLAHALGKPVVLVASKKVDVPFDLRHIRVIYYDMTDPFWGEKLIEKVAENILSAINTPSEATFKSTIDNE